MSETGSDSQPVWTDAPAHGAVTTTTVVPTATTLPPGAQTHDTLRTWLASLHPGSANVGADDCAQNPVKAEALGRAAGVGEPVRAPKRTALRQDDAGEATATVAAKRRVTCALPDPSSAPDAAAGAAAPVAVTPPAQDADGGAVAQEGARHTTNPFANPTITVQNMLASPFAVHTGPPLQPVAFAAGFRWKAGGAAGKAADSTPTAGAAAGPVSANPFAGLFPTLPARQKHAPRSDLPFQVLVLPPPTPPKAPALVPLGSLPSSAKKGTSAPGGLQDWRHEYLHRGEWVPFRPHINQKLNICQRESKWSSARLTIDGEVFVFDFLRMAQVRVETGVQRAFRWTDPKTGMVVPSPVDFSHTDFMPLVLPPWQTPDGLALLDPVPESDPEFLDVKNAFEVADALLDVVNRVVCIHRVRPDANNGFWRHRKQVFDMTVAQTNERRARDGGVDVYEPVRAWHGTSSTAVVGILKSGFTIAPATNGRVLGHGVYFAPAGFPALASTYADADDCGLRHVLVADVLLGRVEKAGVGMMAPSSPEFDNAADCLRNPKRWIVWPTNMTTHVLVKYVVSFRQTGATDIRSCPSPVSTQTAPAAPAPAPAR